MNQISATLGFLSSSSSNPSFTIQEMGQPAIRHGEYSETIVSIVDGRSAKLEMSLDTCGFVLVENTSAADFQSQTSIETIYYVEAADIIKRLTHADHAFVIDYTIRDSSPESNSRSIVTHVHNDYTPRSAMEHASKFAEKNKIPINHRIMEVNVWRPLTEPVLMNPLALADGSTVRPEDLIPCPVVYPDRVGEIYELHYHPEQKWYWFPKMMKNEILVFKGYDSRSEGTVQFVPHTSFHHPDTRPSTPARRSIEIRIIAFIPANEGGS